MLAALPEDDVERLLLSADRFRFDDPAEPGSPRSARRPAARRYGLYGVRLCLDLCARHPDTRDLVRAADRMQEPRGSTACGRSLTRPSPLAATLLKARARPVGLPRRGPSERYPIPARRCAREHRARHRRGARVRRDPAARRPARRSARLSTTDMRPRRAGRSAAPASPAGRLGLDPAAAPRRWCGRRAAWRDAWQRRAEHPPSPQPVRDAARVLVRTCEGC